MRYSRLNDHSLGAGGGWEIAFVADADHFAVEAEGEEYLGGGGKEGDDAHHEKDFSTG